MRARALVFTALMLSAGCATQQANLRRSDGFEESFVVVAASHWASDGFHYALLKLENEGGPKSDSSSKVSILFRFLPSPDGLRSKDAQISLVRSLSRSAQCVKPSSLLLERSGKWSLTGALLVPEGEKESLVSFQVPLAPPSSGSLTATQEPLCP